MKKRETEEIHMSHVKGKCILIFKRRTKYTV